MGLTQGCFNRELPRNPNDSVRLCPCCAGRGFCAFGARGAVVAAGAVVTRDVEPGNVVAGNPARVIVE